MSPLSPHSPPRIFSSMLHLRAMLGAIAVLGCLLTAGGCTFKGDAANKAQRALENGSIWRSSPQSIRIYPSSRFAQAGEQPIVEARVELLDEMGDSTKASGLLRFQLVTLGRASGRAESRQIASWDIKLQTLEDQQMYYDPITRTYFFRLKLDMPQPPTMPTILSVAYTRPAGQRLDAQAPLPVPGQ